MGQPGTPPAPEHLLASLARAFYLNYVFGRVRPEPGSSLWITEERVRAAWREL